MGTGSRRGGDFSTLILLHGFPGNETEVLGLGAKLRQSGVNVWSFNYRGTFQSEGLSSFPNSLADIAAAGAFLDDPENLIKFKIDITFIPEIKHVISIAGNDWGEHIEEYAQIPAMKARIDASMDRAINAGVG